MKLSVPVFNRLLLAALLVYTAYLGALGCSFESPEEKHERLIVDGRKFKDQGKLDEARLSYLSALTAKPEIAQTHFELAEVLIRLKRGGEAMEHYRDALNLDPAHRGARLRIAAILLIARQYEQAKSEINKLLKANADDLEALVLQVNMEMQRQKFDQAESMLKSLLEKHPTNILVLANTAQLELSRGNLNKAEEFYLKALATEPENDTLQLALSDIYVRQGRLDEAQELLKQLVSRNPENSQLHFYFGEFLLTRGQSADALEEYQNTVRVDPLNHQARDRLYDIYTTRDEKDKALELTKDLVEKHPNDPGVFYFKGRDLDLAGKSDEALSNYIRSLDQLRNFSPAYRRAGIIEMAKGDPIPGLQYLDQAIAIDTYDIGARLALARYFFLKNELGQSKKHVEQVLQKFPRQLGANVLRADIFLMEGKSDEAKKVYELLVESFPNSPVGSTKLGLLYEKAKNAPEALKWYSKSISMDYNIQLPLRRYAEIYARESGVDSAIEHLASLKKGSKNSTSDFSFYIGLLHLNKSPQTTESLKAAREMFTTTLTEQPNYLPAYFALARLNAMEGDPKAAIANYEKLIEAQPKHIPSQMLLALSYEQLGDFKKAAARYKNLLNISPRFGPAANNLAWLLVEHLNGDLDEALRLSEIAKQELPKDGGVADTLGWIHYKRGVSRSALTYLEEAVQLEKESNPQGNVNPEILYHLGVVKKSLGDADGGKAELEKARALSKGNEALTKKIEEALAGKAASAEANLS